MPGCRHVSQSCEHLDGGSSLAEVVRRGDDEVVIGGGVAGDGELGGGKPYSGAAGQRHAMSIT